MKRRTWVLILLFFVLFILSIGLIAPGAILHQQLVPFELTERTCFLESVDTTRCGFPVYNGGRVMDSVFSHQLYPINASYGCLCNRESAEPLPGCRPWAPGICYLNLNATRYVQRVQSLYKYGSDALISIGCLIFLSLLITGPILIYKIRRGDNEVEFIIMK